MAEVQTAVSVVVPTRDRPARLERCLAALDRQTTPIELLVIDDGSWEPERTAELVGRRPGARLLQSEGVGPAAARNLGMRAASGTVICFTDDDCEPEPAWAELLARAAAEGSAAGLTLAPAGAGAAVRASQAVIDQLQLDSDPGAGAALAFAPTCNFACRRELLAREPFDEGFTLAAGEDRELCHRLARIGRPPVYQPAAVVVHRQEEGLRALLGRQYRYGRGGVRYRASGGPPAPRGFHGRLLARCASQGPAALGMAVAGQLAGAAGAAREHFAGAAARSRGAGEQRRTG